MILAIKRSRKLLFSQSRSERLKQSHFVNQSSCCYLRAHVFHGLKTLQESDSAPPPRRPCPSRFTPRWAYLQTGLPPLKLNSPSLGKIRRLFAPFFADFQFFTLQIIPFSGLSSGNHRDFSQITEGFDYTSASRNFQILLFYMLPLYFNRGHTWIFYSFKSNRLYQIKYITNIL